MSTDQHDGIFGKSKWIEAPFDSANAPILSREFDIEKAVSSAVLRISGLGIFEAHVNGAVAGDGAYFEPGECDVRKTVYFCTYDITGNVHVGRNAVSVLLGNGQYANYRVHKQPGRYCKTDDARSGDDVDGMFGKVKLIAEIVITYADGERRTIGTDEEWRCAESPITENSWYGGEDYDARLEIDGWDDAAPAIPRVSWQHACLCTSESVPRGVLTERECPSIRIQDADTVTPDKITVRKMAEKDGVTVYLVDMGRNGAGFPQLTVDTDTAGLEIRMFPAEVDDFDGIDEHINQESCTQSASRHGELIYDTYTTKGAGREVWHPRFCYHGYRYLEVDAPSEITLTNENFTGFILRTDNEKRGSFFCSDDVLNSINTLTERSIESNMYSTFTDCPQIEKLGWIETPGLMFSSMAHTYDIDRWSRKLMRDMVDSQCEDGWLTAIAPEYFRIGGLCEDLNWNGSLIFTAWQHYMEYGDASVLSDCNYSAMKRYMDHLRKNVEADGVIPVGHMGEWGEMTQFGKTPTVLVETTAYYRLASIMADIACVRGDDGDADRFRTLADEIKAAFHKNAECHNAEHLYGNGTQSGYGCVLYSGIAKDEYREETVRRLVSAIENTGFHLTSGEVGLRAVFSSLAENGRSDIVYKMVTNDTMPSYKYFILRGQTTLPEYWNFEEPWCGMTRSRNHAMMGHVKEWFTKYLAGVMVTSPGYETVDIKPSVTEPLTFVNGRVGTARGVISSLWMRDDKKEKRTFTLNVSLPAGVAAEVYLPAVYGGDSTVFADGAPADAALTDGGRYFHVRVPFLSNEHTFTVTER